MYHTDHAEPVRSGVREKSPIPDFPAPRVYHLADEGGAWAGTPYPDSTFDFMPDTPASTIAIQISPPPQDGSAAH